MTSELRKHPRFRRSRKAQANKPLYGQPIVAGAAWEAVAAEFSSEIDRGAPPI